ncbi:synaptotagmin-7-like isoform X1 [Anneissia japonica]|uniref:synaptotagmin-7-like isoform X1 n=1 Tax=Anneissia japonica TaxID=1529436 RepID=UPI0014254F8A|nr:synaptotagmin-7-like isoform X1 [Anneissia japonica]XP_033101652.1 synaptotagmin-7-like isoform X1 [Anneissia japonica]XP_033101653.1 synaptotagmin-7-like isoform X1 [Anneissia japonica]
MKNGTVDHVPVFLELLISLASIVSVVIFVLLCGLCDCFSGKKQAEKQFLFDDEERGPERKSASVRPMKRTPMLTRKTIKDSESADGVGSQAESNNGAGKKRIPFRSLSAALLFERPDKKPAVASIQPNVGAAGSKNGLGEFPLDPFSGMDQDLVLMEDQEESLGRIQFSLHYNFTEQTLILKIIRAQDLPAKDLSGTSDPFVKILLLPNKKSKMETKVKKKKLNPTWHETFLFEGFPYNKLQERILHLQVLDYDKFSRNDAIGEVNIPLCDVELAKETTYWKSLLPSKKSAGKLGDILFSIMYVPSQGQLTIVVMKCRNLQAKDFTGKSDPYVKIWHMYKGKRVEKKKTTVKKCTLNPVFNEEFVFDVNLDKIRDTSFIISVLDRDRISKNDIIGSVLIGHKTSPLEMKHWNEMFAKARQPIAQWHLLKDMS